MTLSTPDPVALASALEVAGADGWLLYDFQGVNPVLGQVLGISGMGSRRLFVYLPRVGEPVAVAHRIELQVGDGVSRSHPPVLPLGGIACGTPERGGREACRDGGRGG